MQVIRETIAFVKAIRKLAVETGEGTETLASGLYDILSASVPTSQALDMLGVSARAAKAGLTDTGTTSTAGDNLLSSITTETSPGADDRQAFSFDYTYDANKNVVTETRAPDNAADPSYDYGFTRGVDAKDRLTSWTRANTSTADSQSWNLSFESDWDDTTLTDGGTGTTQTRTHNDPHELLTIDPDGAGSLPAFSQTHDAKGNVMADHTGLELAIFDQAIRNVPVSNAGHHECFLDRRYKLRSKLGLD